MLSLAHDGIARGRYPNLTHMNSNAAHDGNNKGGGEETFVHYKGTQSNDAPYDYWTKCPPRYAHQSSVCHGSGQGNGNSHITSTPSSSVSTETEREL
jgi:hypothetical protein